MIYVIFILPLLAILTGYLMFKYPPKKINYFIGYRTFRSMKNENVWKFANHYCGKLWINIGITMLIITLLLCAFIGFKIITFTDTLLLIVVFCEVSTMLLSIFIVEKKIKNYK